MEFTFFGFGIETMFTESTEYFSDVLLMGREVMGIDEDVVQIYDNAYIQHIRKHAIDKALECCWGISETFRHHQPFIGAIARSEGSLPFVSFRYPDEMISGSEIDLGIDFSTARRSILV